MKLKTFLKPARELAVRVYARHHPFACAREICKKYSNEDWDIEKLAPYADCKVARIESANCGWLDVYLKSTKAVENAD